MVPVQVVDDVLKRLLGGDRTGCGIGHPLGDGEGLFVGIGVIFQDLANVIQALEGAHAGGAHGDDGAGSVDDVLDHVAWHADELIVHGVVTDVLTLNRLEGARTHV